MYGYFRPFSSGLSSKQQEIFKAYYCRLCYCLRLLGGQSARFLTTFDTAIYSIILNIFEKQAPPPFMQCQRIKKENMRKFSSDKTGIKLAKLSFIAFGEKIRDDKIDGNIFRAGIMSMLYKKRVDEAVKEYPKLAQIAYDGTTKINELQNNQAPVDEVLDAYGHMMADSFAEFAPLDKKFRDLYFNLARWTFFIDMLSDYNDDYRDKANNSFKQEDCPTIQDYFDKNASYLLQKNNEIAGALYSSLFLIEDDSEEWQILYKVIYYALNTVAQSILLGKDVDFHYFKELKNNMDMNRVNNKKKRLYGEERR